jgi:hypothetical protein
MRPACLKKTSSRGNTPTKAELVGVDDTMNFVVWIQLFMGKQMKTVLKESALSKFMHETVILQNGSKQSNTKRTRHTDYLTKPLQGLLFRNHRNSIMGAPMGVLEMELSIYQDEYVKMKEDLWKS